MPFVLFRVIAELNNMALGRSLVGHVHANDSDGVSIVLWDTSGENEDININETLLNKMKSQVIICAENTSKTSSMPSLEQASPNAKSPTSHAPMDKESIVTKSDSIMARNLVTTRPEPVLNSDLNVLMNMDLTSFKPLTRAVLPDADDFFDVTVTMAGSPSNFTVSNSQEIKNVLTISILSKGIVPF